EERRKIDRNRLPHTRASEAKAARVHVMILALADADIAAASIAGNGGLNSWGIQTPCSPASSASRTARSNSLPGIDSRTVHRFLTMATGIFADTRAHCTLGGQNDGEKGSRIAGSRR